MIIGSAGSGKSTLAVRLGKTTGLPVIHVDNFYWKEGWVLRESEETGQLINVSIQGPGWIFEGNHSSSFDIRIAKADTLIFLDLPTGICIFRAIKRLILNYGEVRPENAPGCPERFNWQYLKFLKWIYDYQHRRRLKALKLVREAPSSVAVIHLNTRSSVKEFIQSQSSLHILPSAHR